MELLGTMSEFELSLLRQRARQAFEQKAGRGHAMWEVPVGFVRTEDDRCEQTPDRQVRQAVAAVFRKFRELGSARQTTLWYRDQQITLPYARPGTSGREVAWAAATLSRVRQILRNPCYAGALAYGRTTARSVIADGRARQAGRRRQPQEQWKVLLLDNHRGYISWEDFQQNQRTLEANLIMREGQKGGAARGGGALLSGLLRCGRCGRRMGVLYSGSTGRVPRYACDGGRVDRGLASWLSFGAWRVDDAVAGQVLEAVAPAGVEASLLALERLGGAQDERRQSLTLSLERARYEAGRARRQYEAVDPENRLVAAELEARWNSSLAAVADLEQRLRALEQARVSVAPERRERLLDLGRRLPALWHHPAASPELKKRIIRTVLHEVVVEDAEAGTKHLLVLHWQGGVHTELKVPRNRPGHHRRTTGGDAIELIGELSKVCSDAAIAATLNRLGYRTGAGKTWRSHSVQNARYHHRLPNYAKGADWLTVEGAAEALGVSETVVRRLIKDKSLPARQVVTFAPWIIARADLDLPVVQAAVQAVRQGRQPPKIRPDQGEIPWN
jgi:hypothetical protein